jgi:hypothetical protein
VKLGYSASVPRTLRLLTMMSLGWPALQAQWWDPGASLPGLFSQATEDKLKMTFEFRSRYEDRSGVNFGKSPDQNPLLMRTRLGMSYQPVPWIQVSGMVQDASAPLSGPNAPTTARDHAALQEGYIGLFPDQKEGFWLTVGREMLNYGEARLLGTPLWGNVSRTYDQARVGYRRPFGQFDLLVVSPVKIRIGEFNRPTLGDRMFGSYNSFPQAFRKTLIDVYLFRREQNREGGFTGGVGANGTDRQATNTLGFRMAGPLAWGAKFSMEGALQDGKVGPSQLHAGGWFSGISRRWTLARKQIELSGEYKYASGTSNPKDPTRDGTFDQLYAAYHDTFGHQDLLGWRNLHNIRSLATYRILKNVAVNAMYSNFWLASASDAVYNGSGVAILRSATGLDGRHIGQESDAFATLKVHHYTFGSGYGRFFNGEFIRRTTPNTNPNYVYVFQTYTL